ncbi:MAG: hypothetical protein IPK12_23495 [Gemmatimonadetes bacterium]|nr:hypothetical protein [Gemmatimonadota bacterium]
MTAHRAQELRRDARWVGGGLILFAWLVLTAASAGAAIDVPGWLIALLSASGTGLVLWGSFKTRVEKLEEARREDRAYQDREMEKRLSTAVFTQFQGDLTDRLERIERKIDGRPA